MRKKFCGIFSGNSYLELKRYFYSNKLFFKGRESEKMNFWTDSIHRHCFYSLKQWYHIFKTNHIDIDCLCFTTQNVSTQIIYPYFVDETAFELHVLNKWLCLSIRRSLMKLFNINICIVSSLLVNWQVLLVLSIFFGFTTQEHIDTQSILLFQIYKSGQEVVMVEKDGLELSM